MKDRSTLGCERLSAKTKVALGARFNHLMRLSRTLTRDGQRQGHGVNLSPSPLSRRSYRPPRSVTHGPVSNGRASNSQTVRRRAGSAPAPGSSSAGVMATAHGRAPAGARCGVLRFGIRARRAFVGRVACLALRQLQPTSWRCTSIVANGTPTNTQRSRSQPHRRHENLDAFARPGVRACGDPPRRGLARGCQSLYIRAGRGPTASFASENS